MTRGCHQRAACTRHAALVLTLAATITGTARAQVAADCATPRPPGIGVAFGRSLPYVELATGAVPTGGPGPVSVRSGAHVAGRAEVPVSGPLHLRIEAATARWDVRQQRFDPGGTVQVIADDSIDRVTARHLTALAGVRLGRAPTCAYLAAGGGVYAIGFRGTPVRGPGAAIAAGMEVPTGARGVIQLDATVHLIRTRYRGPIAMSDVPTLSLLAGWMYRF